MQQQTSLEHRVQRQEERLDHLAEELGSIKGQLKILIGVQTLQATAVIAILMKLVG